ncbi:MAG: S8 family serine peptidase, partial [Actinokineospora sp.]
MDSPRSRRSLLRSTAISLFITAVVAAVAPPSAGAAPGAADPPGPGLSRHDRQLLAEARADGKAAVTMLIATNLGASDDVSKRVAGLGGRVDYHDQALGYVRASVPIDRAEQAAKVSGVHTADLDETIELDDPRPVGQTTPTPFPPPDASTPRANPYMPIADTGADAFTAAHTTWDGRGVTVGVLDTGITLDHPALATTTTGAPKITDWVTYTHPLTDGDPTWVTTSVVSGPAFTAGGVAYTAPAGSFRFGVFDERHANLGGEIGNDVNRDGNPAGSIGTFGVLWDPPTGTVWV